MRNNRHTNSHTVSVILDHVHLNINVQCTYVCMTVIHLHFPIKLIHLRERGCVFARERLHMILDADYDENESHDLTKLH